MKENELMIGDWVYDKSLTYPNLPCKVHSIEGRYPRINKEFDSQPIIDVWVGDGFLSSHIENIEPIPLTEEILEKNKFTKRRDHYYLDFGFLGIDWKYSCAEIYVYNNIVIDIECNHPTYTNRVHFIITYVHELLHILRFCGLNELADNFKV